MRFVHKALFLDKDGTLVDNLEYPKIIPTDELMEHNVLQGLLDAQKKGYTLFIVSNQSWISQGRLKKDDVEKTFQSLKNKLREKGVVITDYAYCPHQEKENCECRKPKAGLITGLVDKHNINVQGSFMIGDMDDDISAGMSAGLKTVLVLTGCGSQQVGKCSPDFVIKNVNEVNKII